MTSSLIPPRTVKDSPAEEAPRLIELRRSCAEAVEEADRDGWLTEKEVFRALLGDDWDKDPSLIVP